MIEDLDSLLTECTAIAVGAQKSREELLAYVEQHCEQLRDVRLRARVSQKELAARAGEHQAYISEMERGDADRIGVGAILRILGVYRELTDVSRSGRDDELGRSDHVRSAGSGCVDARS